MNASLLLAVLISALYGQANAYITARTIPIHGFIHEPPSRSFLCKIGHNDNCTAVVLYERLMYNKLVLRSITSGIPLETYTLDYNVNYVPSMNRWKRVQLDRYIETYNATHDLLQLRFHDAPILPHMSEYVLLGTKNHFYGNTRLEERDVEVLHRLRTSSRIEPRVLWSVDASSTIALREFTDNVTFVTSLPHIVPHDKLNRYGSLIAFWITPDQSSVVQIIDYYYPNGRRNNGITPEHEPSNIIDCPRGIDRQQCAQTGISIACCNKARYYECDENGVVLRLKSCPTTDRTSFSYYYMNIRKKMCTRAFSRSLRYETNADNEV